MAAVVGAMRRVAQSFAIRNVAPLTSRLGGMIPHADPGHGLAENTAGAPFFAVCAKGAGVGGMRRKLERRFGLGHHH